MVMLLVSGSCVYFLSYSNFPVELGRRTSEGSSALGRSVHISA
jgi:hypothetical protein